MERLRGDDRRTGSGKGLTNQPVPGGLLVCVYLLYLGLTSSASVPIFAAIDWLHEGERLGTAQIILNGGLPIRDVYLPHGFLSDVIRPLLAFRLFGESLASDRLMGLLLAPLPYVAAVFYLWQLFPSKFWRIVGLAGFALYPLLLLPRHVVVLLALGLLTAWTRRPQRRLLVGTGLLTGLGFLLSTMDQAVFLLVAVCLVPVVIALERWASNRSVATGADGDHRTLGAAWRDVALPLYLGVAAGLLPFLGYLALTSTADLFVSDLFRRAEADAYAFAQVWGYKSLPPLSPVNAVWYMVPFFYVALASVIATRVVRRGDRSWTAILPTLLFGMVSFVYAVRQFSYWKLAVVSFPFIAAVTYALAVVERDWAEPSEKAEPQARSAGARALLGITGVLMVALLVQALMRDWMPKQIAPRYLFPAFAMVILGAAAAAGAERLQARRRRALAVICPVAALIVSVWFYADAKPQILAAQIKKPKVIGEAVRLASEMAGTGARLSREFPPYLQDEDEVVAYLKEKHREGRRVVLLAAGAGVYYFQAGVAAPNRFPHIEVATAEAWAREVAEGLDRTRAELLVSCRDRGATVTGWPINPLLSAFILSNYVDSGQKLRGDMLGEACPFTVWVRREG